MNYCKKQYPGNPQQIYNNIVFYCSIVGFIIILYMLSKINTNGYDTYLHDTNSSDTNSSDTNSSDTNSSDLYEIKTLTNTTNITHYLRGIRY